MTWWETLPTFAATLLVYLLPGLLILAAAGVRRLNLAALAAPVSASVAGSSAVVLPYLRLPFNPGTYFAITGLLAALVLTVRHLLRLRRERTGITAAHWALEANDRLSATDTGLWVSRFAIPVAVLFPAMVISARYVAGFGSPESFSETFDNIYHLNAVRHIAETQNGSTLTLGNLTEASRGLYPAAMHDSMALVLMLGAPSVMVAVNVGTIITGAVVWPLACIFLISRVVGYRPMPLLAAGVLSAGFSAFPYLMVAYGVLYPNHAALALLPAVLGLAIEALGMSRSMGRSWMPPGLALLATLPGLALSHPSAFVALLGFSSPVVLAACVRAVVSARTGFSTRSSAQKWLAFTLAYAVVTVAVWTGVRPDLSSAGWTSFQTNARALGEILGSAPMGTTTAWLLLVLTVIGLYVVARHFRRLWWIGGMYAVGGLLFLIVSSWTGGPFRDFLTGVWYRDSYRLAALLPIVTLPIVVLGAEWIVWRVRWLAGALMSQPANGTSPLPQAASRLLAKFPGSTGAAAGCVVLLILGVGVQGGSLSGVQNRIHTVFSTTDGSGFVSTDEVALFNEVAGLVPASDVIVGNPRTGAALVYAFSGRRTVAPHIFGIRTDQEQLLLDHWSEAAYNPRVCPAIHDQRAYWALDLGDTEITPRAEPLLGVRDLADDSAPGVELVKAVGKARLFRVTACG